MARRPRHRRRLRLHRPKVHRDGRLVGAIGVGGGAPEQDHAFALTAVEALV
ncbi:heme-binding protein [Streptomyces sp. NPDC051742]|uniref:heme-binding protein n=1 Tax=Streptomyces sp. NPDC051742 TaxID=3155169 RepID=UPI00341C4186